MRRLVALSILSLSLGAVLPACSALGLDNLPEADCVQGSGGVSGDAFCTSLGTLVPLPDTCTTWQCNEQTHHCQQLPRDDDGDGYPLAMCAGGQTPDCHDDDARNHPNGMETCDGRDENCDDVADDGVIAPPASAESMLTTLSDNPAVTMTYQPDVDQAMVIAGYTGRFDAITVDTAVTPNDLTFRQGATPIVASTTGLAIRGLGGMSYALVAHVTTTCPQWGVFPVAAGQSAISLRTTDQFTLPSCAAGGGQITAPAVAGIADADVAGHLIAVAWLAGPDAEYDCGMAPARDVVVSAATLNYAALGHNIVSNDVVTLGQSVGNGPPIVTAVGDAFVVAYPRADHTIAVHLVHVTVDAGGVHVSPSTAMPTPDYVEPAAAATPQFVVMATSSAAMDGSIAFGLAWISDCGATSLDNTITMRLITRQGNTLTAAPPTTGITGGRGLAYLRLVYQPRVGEWLLTWRGTSSQRAQRLQHTGALEGDSFVVRAMGVGDEYAVEPLASGPLYRAIVRDGTALSQIPFGCAP